MEKTQRKVTIYDKLSPNESTLVIFIAFGLILTAIVMGVGYLNGNNNSVAVPAGIENQEETETEVFLEENGRQNPENESEDFDNVDE